MPPARHLDPKEVASLLRRAEELKAAGDIAAARLLLQRVAGQDAEVSVLARDLDFLCHILHHHFFRGDDLELE